MGGEARRDRCPPLVFLGLKINVTKKKKKPGFGGAERERRWLVFMDPVRGFVLVVNFACVPMFCGHGNGIFYLFIMDLTKTENLYFIMATCFNIIIFSFLILFFTFLFF